jgi:hypothetical protein
MFGAAGTGFWDITLEITLENNLFWLIAAVAFCMPIYPRVRAFIENRPALANVAGWLKTPANLLMLATNTALLVGSSYNPFLYYRFDRKEALLWKILKDSPTASIIRGNEKRFTRPAITARCRGF